MEAIDILIVFTALVSYFAGILVGYLLKDRFS